MAKKYQKAKSGASSLIMRVVAIVLMLVMIGAIVMAVLQYCTPAGQGLKPSEWFGGTATNQPKDPDEDQTGGDNGEDNVGAGGSLLPSEVKGSGIRLLSAVIPEEEYSEYGIEPQADSAYTVTAIIEPEEATNKAVRYSAKFENASSAWANGKAVSDYVTVSQSSAGSLTASITVKQVFGEPVIITATSEENTDISASFPVHYVKRISGITSSVACAGTGMYSIGLGKDTSYTTAITLGTGTVQGTFEVSAKINFSDSYFWAPFKSNSYYTQGMNYSGYSGTRTPKTDGWALTLSTTDGSSGNFRLTDSRDFFTVMGGGDSTGMWNRFNTALYQSTKGWTTSSSASMGNVTFTIVNKYVDSKGTVHFTESKTSQALIKVINMSAISVSVSSLAFPDGTAIYG